MSSKGWHSQDSTQARHGSSLIKGDGFGGRSIAMLTPKVNTEIRLLIGASGADTHGAMWNVRMTKSTKVVAHKIKISSNGDGGFPFSASATKSGVQTNTDSSEFGNSLAAIGDVDGDGKLFFLNLCCGYVIQYLSCHF